MDIRMENIQDFLKEYSLLKHKKEADLNFFQIAGFPHYENVSSNILSFYFNDEYVLKSFLNCIPDYKPSIDFVKEINREERTENNKRIDIVISTNKYIIGIENKINAWLYNPIDDYYSYLNSRAKNEGKELLLIILSKNKIESNTKYKNVLYKDFSNELKKYYPELLNRLGYKYFFLLTEYIANIEFLEEGYSMNKEFIEIAKQDDNLGKIEQIMSEGIRLRNDLINTAGRILNDLQEYTKSFETKSIFKEQGQIFGTAMFQDCYLTDKKYNCTIDVDVMVSGFGMSIYECNKRFDTEFKNILMEILPDLSKDYDLSDRAIYKYDIKLEEYDKLIMLLKNIFDAFDKYIKSKNYGA
jgi:hypothetical protein